jgi:hypothetical protein
MQRIRNRVREALFISRTNPPQQFDEYVWFDETRAVTPLDTAEIKRSSGHLSVRRGKQDVDLRP